jgi:ATP-dependent RNA helicase DDX18/HAS1
MFKVRFVQFVLSHLFKAHQRHFQLEKLLQKNYFLHQSARDGYRSYLQAYASYSLKKIFDINALDLAKVGKAFGFSVPPRVNVNVGGGMGGTGGSKRKRQLGEDDEEEVVDGEDGVVEGRNQVRGKGKGRRTETLGQKSVDKEIYRKGRERKKMAGSGQWGR